MKKFKQTFAMFCCILILASMSGPFSVTASAAGPSIAYNAFVTNYGWQTAVWDGGTAGTEGRGLQIEQLNIWLDGGASGSIIANAHVQNIGWTGETSGFGVSVGAGQGLRMEAITLKLDGAVAKSYSIVYRVHCQNYGWMDWKRNGEIAGTVGESLRIEGIQIRLEPKPHIAYRAHVSNAGWLGYVQDGVTAGTVGQGLQLECLELALGGLSGNIVVTSHVQNIGWMPYQGAQHVVTGTQGQGLRMEAIRLWVQGEVANGYSIEYRTHVQNIGWQDWVRDGAVAGTEGQSLRIEAIQIRLVPKGSSTNNTSSNTAAQSPGGGSANSASTWQWPVRDYYVTQPFGNYYAPKAPERPYHAGMDIKNTECKNTGTTPVYAAADGKIIYRGQTNGNGNHVVIQHNINGRVIRTLYSHLRDFSDCPGVNQNVSKGQKIGMMGNTGAGSTGPHLHFAIYEGNSVDPDGYSSAYNSVAVSHKGCVFYNPDYVISNNRLP